MATIYRHRRASDNKVFYIGYSKRNYICNQKGEDGRPWNSRGRTRAWKNIVKYHGLIVEILISGITIKDALKIETGLIEYYGRLDLKTGTLINFTNGGELNAGWVMTVEQKEKQRKALQLYWANMSEERRLEISEISKRKALERGITTEHKEAMMKAQKEKVFTDEYRKKLSEAAKNRHKNMSPERRQELNENQSKKLKEAHKNNPDWGKHN